MAGQPTKTGRSYRHLIYFWEGMRKVMGQQVTGDVLDVDINLWVWDGTYFRAVCGYSYPVEGWCPNNQKGLCMSRMKDLPWDLIHPFDGMNNWKCPCG